MYIKKVKLVKDKIYIEWGIENTEGEPDEYSLKLATPALESFYDAMRNLLPHWQGLLELPASYAETAKITGVSFSWTNEIMGAVITASKTLSTADSPVALNTPHLPEAPYSDSGSNPILPKSTTEALDILHREAERYVEGERSQLAMELPAPQEKPAEPEQGSLLDQDEAAG